MAFQLGPAFQLGLAHSLGPAGRTLPCRYIDLTVKTEHTVLTKSIYLNTESHNLS